MCIDDDIDLISAENNILSLKTSEPHDLVQTCSDNEENNKDADLFIIETNPHCKSKWGKNLLI